MSERGSGSEQGQASGVEAAEPTALTEADVAHLAPSVARPRRAELLVAAGFLISILGTVGFAWVYWIGGQPQAEGTLIGFAMGGAGFGMAAWGKYLMPRGPFMEEREALVTTKEEKAAFNVAFQRGAKPVQRRGLLGLMMGGAVAAFGVVATFPLLRSLGPRPGKRLYGTNWKKGSRLVDISGRYITTSALEVGGITTVFPEGHTGSAVDQAVDQTLLLRAATTPVTTRPGRGSWSPLGYLAYSKVCTHAGCPVSLYEEQYQQLLCPCHQSLFNVLDGAQPIFGPAPRPLPQLALMVDDEGYLASQGGYDEPIGPGFWERGAVG